MSEPPGLRLLRRPALEAAPLVLGSTLLLDGVGGVVVEVEAYRKDDPASHSYAGETRRTASMFGPPGRLYVYRSHGIHWCLNLVCGDVPGAGEALLVRALRPTHGLEAMRERSPALADVMLCSGPGRLGRALGVGPAEDGLPLGERLQLLPAAAPAEVATGTRIGISKAVEQPWRFALAGDPHVSRPRPWARARA